MSGSSPGQDHAAWYLSLDSQGQEDLGGPDRDSSQMSVSSNVRSYFEELIDDVEAAIHATLGKRTLRQALSELQRRAQLSDSPRKTRQSRLSRQ